MFFNLKSSQVSQLFPLHLNTYMLWIYSQYKYFNSFSARIDFRHHSLTQQTQDVESMLV